MQRQVAGVEKSGGKFMQTIQIDIDDDLKKAVEAVYASKGITFSEAVKIFAEKSVELGTSPFFIKNKRNSARGALSKNANPALITLEDGAWERAVAEKYAEKAD